MTSGVYNLIVEVLFFVAHFSSSMMNSDMIFFFRMFIVREIVVLCWANRFVYCLLLDFKVTSTRTLVDSIIFRLVERNNKFCQHMAWFPAFPIDIRSFEIRNEWNILS